MTEELNVKFHFNQFHFNQLQLKLRLAQVMSGSLLDSTVLEGVGL